MSISSISRASYPIISDPALFAQYTGGIRLRDYQVPAVRAIVDSVFARCGDSIVIEFSRQSGKDESLVQVMAYLLRILHTQPATILYASPTFRPQTLNAMQRLQGRLSQNVLTLGRWKKRAGYIFQLGQASVSYLSAEPTANVVGATASHLLIINEAQDVLPGIYDKRFAPMAAAHNATRVFAGTAWAADSLLERERASAALAQSRDGRQRVFLADADIVGAESELYASHVLSEIQRLGRQHPLVKTQYFCETLDVVSGMFSPAILSTIESKSEIPAHLCSSPVSFLLDVAGQSESSPDPEAYTTGGRDSTTLTVVSIDLSSLPLLGAPTYHVIARHTWTGSNHIQVFGQIKALAENYRPAHLVIDASGVGEGLWAMLDHAFPHLVIPVKFTSSKKSDIAWRFLAITGTGRFRDHCHTPAVHDQYLHCRSEILPGPDKLIRWGVPDGLRSSAGELLHDDYVLADSLTAELDLLPWSISTPTLIVPVPDPLKDMEKAF